MAARSVPLHRAWTPEKVRQRIKTSLISNRLTDHILGKAEMSASQVTAALGLLRKTLPDLLGVAHSGALELTKPEELTDQALAHIASTSGHRVIETPGGEAEPDSVH